MKTHGCTMRMHHKHPTMGFCVQRGRESQRTFERAGTGRGIVQWDMEFGLGGDRLGVDFLG